MGKVAIVSSDEIEEIKKIQFLILKKLDKIDNTAFNDELVTVKQAHEITKISEQKIRQMILDGKLETNEKYGRSKRIYRRSL